MRAAHCPQLAQRPPSLWAVVFQQDGSPTPTAAFRTDSRVEARARLSARPVGERAASHPDLMPDRPGGLAAGGGGLQVDSGLVAYLKAHQSSARYLFATLSSQSAAAYIIVTGKPVLALGGFSGSDQILTLSQLKTLIRQGQVRYFLAGGGGGGFGGGAGNAQLVQWIEANFSQVSASAIGGSSTGAQLYVVTAATLAAAGS